MDAVFQKLLSLSFQAGIIALVVMVLRVLLRKAPKTLICSLWLLVALRLLVPFSLESRISLIQSPELPEILTEEKVSEVPPASIPSSEPSPAVPDLDNQMEAPMPVPVVPGRAPEAEARRSLDVLTVLEIVWGTGVLGIALYGSINYGRLRHKVSPALEVRKGIYFCDYIESPFVMGTLRPRIYLPSSIVEKDIPYILAHEQAHIRRLDPLWKQIGFLLLTLHWFNPMLWLAFILFCRDIESACDEKVITRMGDSAKVPYSNALLNCSLPRGRIYPLAFGEIGVKQRIKEVINYRKPTLWITIAAVLALILAGVCLLTNRPQNSLSEVYALPENQSVQLMGKFKLYDMKSQEELTAVEDFLRTVRYDRSPLETPPDSHALGTLSLTTGTLEARSGLFFTSDGSQVAIGFPEEPEAGYAIENPEAVTAFFDKWLKPFANRDTAGEPLWQEDAPWVWTKGVDADRLLKVTHRTWTKEKPDYDAPGFSSSRSTQGGGIYSEQNVEKLMDLLHSLKKSDFTLAEDFQSTPMDDISEPIAAGVPCNTVYFYDDIDRLVLVIRQEQEQLDFYAGKTYELDQEQMKNGVSFQHWELHSPALLSYMQALEETSPTVATFVGWEHDWDDPREMSHGDALICLPVIKGWEVEEVYQDDHTPWGFRLKPEGQEGSLFFSFWPDGFSMEEEDRYYSDRDRYGFERSVISYPASVLKSDGSFDTRDVMWSYQLFQGDIGDYAIVNEGVDQWYFQYREAAEDICTLTIFQGKLPEDMPKTMAGPDISLWRKTITPEDLENPTLLVTEITPDRASDEPQSKISLDAQALEPFLSILHSLNEEDIWDMEYQQKSTVQNLMALETDRGQTAAILLPIREQNQVAVLVYQYRADEDRRDLRFFVTDEYETLLADPGAKVPFGEYRLEDQLLSFGAEQLITRAYNRKWQEPVTMAQSPGRIRLSLPIGWETEEVPSKDDGSPWGFRVKPHGEEGSLFFSFCPEGLPDRSAGQLNRLLYQPQFAPFGGSVEEQYSDDDYEPDWERKEDACWEFRLYRCSFGDYVIFNEDADAWIQEHREEISDILTLCDFQGDPVIK